MTIFRGQNDSYEELALLSDKGGMSLVYLCRPMKAPEDRVAVKTARQDLPPAVAAMFLREAEAAAQVAGPNVVPLVDWGKEPAFISYEYMSSGTLADDIHARRAGGAAGTLPELLAAFRQLSEGMDAINRFVIHRDLKPDNIFLAGGALRIGDFGISKYVGEVTRTKTFKGWGTISYMAPEMLRGESIDWKADQYSLGIIFYELATLELPFRGDGAEVEQAHLYRVPERVTSARPELPERLASLVARMLEKRVERRFESWGQLIAELDAISAGGLDAVGPPASGRVRRAAEALHAARERATEEQRAEDDQRMRESERDHLISYWADEFFGLMQAAVDELNQELGEPAYQLHRSSGRCHVQFMNGHFEIGLQPAPVPNPSNALAWGRVDLRTPGRLSVANLLLLEEPAPYGTWLQVDMRIRAMMRPGATPDHEAGENYEILGRERLVLATTWTFLLRQRQLHMKGVTAVASYVESPLNFTELSGELLDLLTEDGPKAPPARREERPRLQSPYDR